jgi:hypothetical protein
MLPVCCGQLASRMQAGRLMDLMALPALLLNDDPLQVRKHTHAFVLVNSQAEAPRYSQIQAQTSEM